jgi:hypothetical protein
MAIKIGWEKAGEVLRVDFGPAWTVEEYHAAIMEANALVGVIETGVSVILNLENSPLLPKGNAFTLGRHAVKVIPPNVRRLIIVTNSEYVKAIANTFFVVYQIKGLEVVVVDSLDDAHARTVG